MSTLLLVGLGGLGGVLLEWLAREERVERIVVGSRSVGRSVARCNLARLGAMAQGYAPSIDLAPLDLDRPETVIEVVQREKPDIVLSTATRQAWWLPDMLPPEQGEPLQRAGFGMWLPVHLALSIKLMQALRAAGYRGVTLTAPFPDVIHCILSRLGLAPTCGVGNLDEIVPKVRLLAARRLGVPLNGLRVLLVAHHALEPAAFGEPMVEIPPYFLRIEYGGRDVTGEAGGDELLLAPYPLPSGPATHFLTAGSTVRLVRALLGESGELLHAPGPHGLPGGYPVVASRAGVQVAPVDGLTLEQAIEINERSHRFDGIERIEADGSVVFCPESAELFRQVLGYDCRRLSPGDVDERADELIARFRECAQRAGVALPGKYARPKTKDE